MSRVIPISLLLLMVSACSPSPAPDSAPEKKSSSNYKQMLDEAKASADSLSQRLTGNDEKAQEIREKARQ